MKIKLIESRYDHINGTSHVKIGTDLGVFTGTSKLHDEDRDIESTFAGCTYAEMRAIEKYMKFKIKLLKEQEKAVNNCIKAIKNKKNYNHNSVENRTLRKQVYLLKKMINDWEDKSNSLHQKLLERMSKRRKIIKKITKKEMKK